MEPIPAIAWTCTYCERLNYQQLITTDVVEREEIYRELYCLHPDDPLPSDWNEDEYVSGLLRFPDTVDCISCKSRHALPKGNNQVIFDDDDLADYDDDEYEYEEEDFLDEEDYHDWDDL